MLIDTNMLKGAFNCFSTLYLLAKDYLRFLGVCPRSLYVVFGTTLGLPAAPWRPLTLAMEPSGGG